MYNLSAYYIARTFADIPAELVNTVLFVVIAYWFGGLKHDAGSFFGLLFRWVDRWNHALHWKSRLAVAVVAIVRYSTLCCVHPVLLNRKLSATCHWL
jgi:hypothetical protein